MKQHTIQPTRAMVALAITMALASTGMPATAALAPQPVPTSVTADRPGMTQTTPTTVTEIDDLQIESEGFDVGGDGFAAGAPTDSARVEWDHTAFVIPWLRGSIHFDDVASSCARVRLLSYDGWGNEVDEVFSDEECAYRDGHIARPFELQGGGGVTEVKVTLQTLAMNGTWGNVGSRTVTYGPTIDTDEVSISRAEFDVGAGAFVNGTASDPATVTWTVPGRWSDTHPVFSGTLYMNSANDLCGRVRVKYYYSWGGVIDTTPGTDHCVTDDDLHTFPVVFDPINTDVAEVRYIIESKGSSGDWSTVGMTTATRN